MIMAITSGNLVRLSSFNSLLQFVRPNYSRHFASGNRLILNDDPQLFLDSIRQQCRLGFISIDVPVSIFHQLNSLRPRPSIILFNQLFTSMSKIKPNPPFSTVITLFNELEVSGRRPDMHSVGILAKCYCSLGRVDFAFSLLGKYLKLGYPPHIVIITTLLNGLIDSDKLRQAVHLLDKIVKLQIHPSLVTYGSMFKGLCRSGDNAGALRLLRNMESRSPFKPNVVIYSTIIDSLSKDRLLPQALCLFHEMKAKSILPDVVTYTTLIQGLCSLGSWDDAKQLWVEMLNNNIAPNIETYSILVDSYCKEGNVVEARAIFEYMTKRGMHANIITYSALLDGYCLRGEMREAEKLLDIMVKNGVMPNVVTFNSLINGYCKSKKIDKAMAIFQDMHLKGTHITPNVISYNTLIDALCKNKRLDLANQLFKDMQDRGVAPDVFTYNTLLDGLLRNAQIDEAISLRIEMENNGVAPSIVTYSTIINGLCEAGQLVEAEKVFSTLVAKRLRPNVTTYNIQIKVLCRQGRVSDATKILKQMVESECPPDECTYNTIIKGFLNANDIVVALEHLQCMRSKGFAADASTASLFLGLLTAPNVGDEDKALLQKYFLEKNADELFSVSMMAWPSFYVVPYEFNQSEFLLVLIIWSMSSDVRCEDDVIALCLGRATLDASQAFKVTEGDDHNFSQKLARSGCQTNHISQLKAVKRSQGPRL
ncbi:hypothetical protein KSS87_019041 [Heliosperma pusillum]|nr:hypothetical protein KSS87_019041 [Heliosperma pusillum]